MTTKKKHYPRIAQLVADRRRERLARYSDPKTAEDDYFRMANRQTPDS